MKNGKVILKTYNNIYFKSSILEYKFCSSFSKTILSQLFIFNLHIFFVWAIKCVLYNYYKKILFYKHADWLFWHKFIFINQSNPIKNNYTI